MNFANKSIFFTVLLMAVLPSALAQLDTVVIYDTIGTLGDPYRSCQFIDKNNGYLDSIRSTDQIINKGNQNYYLKVFNPDTVLILEGDWFDSYPSGLYLAYNSDGLLTDSAYYSLVKLEKPLKYKCKAKSNLGGRSYKFDAFFYYNSTDVYPKFHHEYSLGKKIKTIIYRQDGRTVQEYNTRGEIRKTYSYDLKNRLISNE